VTELQFRKFHESVERQPGPDLFIPFLKEVALENRMQHFKLLTYRSYQFNGTKRSPASFNTTAPNFIERLKDDFQCKGVRDILDDQTCCDVMADSLDDIWYPLNFEVDEIDPDPSVGRISVIQERGLKARFIANPKLSFQIGLRSLGYNLFALLRTLPWDCTYDQQKGIDWGQTQLKEGKRLYSVDISDASNNMPLRSTLRVLEWIGTPPEQLTLFEKVSTGKWFIPKSCQPKELASTLTTRKTLQLNTDDDTKHKYLQWTQGQPLGLFPSFPAFTLWHGMVLRSIETRYRLTDTFTVLGDDVLISNPLVNWQYRVLMEKLTVPISLTKTFSGKAGEFAGTVILPHTSFKPQKFLIPSKNNLILRLFRSMANLHEGDSVDKLISYLRSMTTSEFKNSEGFSIEQRARLARSISSLIDEVEVLPVCFTDDSKELYNKLCSNIVRRSICEPIHRHELDSYLNELVGRPIDRQAKKVSLYEMISRSLRIGVSMLPIEFALALRKADTGVFPQGSDLLYFLGEITKQHQQDTPTLAKLRRLYLVNSVKNTVKKSKSVVDQEVNTLILRMLEGKRYA
jgi:hypothetical protein